MSDIQDAIRLALAKLDATNDDHWTENGQPRLDALGFKEKLSRSDVTAAAPLFTRANPVVQVAEAEAPKVAPAPVAAQPTLEEDYAALCALCDEADDKFTEAQKKVEAAKGEMEALSIRRDALIKRLDKARPKDENQKGIQAVLARSLEVRAERAEIAKQLKAVGVTQALLQAGSPLDRAMSRKRGLGLNRPTIPMAVGAK